MLVSAISLLNRVSLSCSGTIRRFGECTAQFQQMYVGNAAWAHIVAAEAMRQSPQEVGGQAYFITDDSPSQNIFEMMTPYLQLHGLNVSDRKARFWVVYSLIYIFEAIFVWLRPIVKLNLPIETCRLTYLNNTYTFNSIKARKTLGYSPLFTYSEAMKRSLEYYKSIDLKSL